MIIDLISEYGMFLAKVATLVVAILFVIGGIATAAARNRQRSGRDGELRVKYLNEEFDDLRESIIDEVWPEQRRKAEAKKKRKEEKARAKQRKKAGGEDKAPPRLFVLDFNGDLQASDVETLRREISAILEVAEADDEVLLRLESPGGLVHSYGLAASQLKRLRGRGLKLTVAVDQVAASGGYMMACIGDRILSAPFAVIGSIGVVAQIPNVHRLLKKHDVDVELMTAGEYKRTLTMLGENTDKARAKFQEELEETHQLFKSFVREHRRGLDIDAVATGEHWFGSRAKELGLVDDIMTSDEYLQGRKAQVDIYQITWEEKRKLADRLSLSLAAATQRVVDRFWQRGSQRPFQ
ncbi:protease SohB [Alloalcanivorax xenomutans]|nr:MAG: protease SohB [Alcanivorax sp.]CUR47302.1 SohB protein, peptidase U7 family [Alloalcanivorax xenomutans]